MFNSHAVHTKHFDLSGSYGQNLWQAFQIFLAALFDVKPADKPVQELSEEDRQSGIEELYRLARKFDATMPTQSAELRDLAARGRTGSN